MPRLGSFAGVFSASVSTWALLALVWTGGCTDDGGTGTTETGTETQAATETNAGDGDGDACTPDGVFGDCANGGLSACMASNAPQCVQDDPNTPSIGVCGSPCVDDCDCWAAPATGDAPATCKALVTGDDGTCVLDCSGGQACPSAMSCLETLGICVFSVN